MNRKIQDLINSDRTIVDLRMQSEDLINNMELMTEKDFAQASQKISEAIDARIQEIFEQQSPQ